MVLLQLFLLLLLLITHPLVAHPFLLPWPLHHHKQARHSTASNGWRSLFSSIPVPSSKTKKINDWEARLQHALEKIQQQQPHNPSFTGTWTINLKKQEHMHSSPPFQLAGFPFRLLLTESSSIGTAIHNAEGLKGGGWRPVGLHLEYIPRHLGLPLTLTTTKEAASSLGLPSVTCQIRVLDPSPAHPTAKELRTLTPHTFDAGGAALGAETFTWVRGRQKLCLGFHLTLDNVHFPGAQEQAEIEAKAWEVILDAVDAAGGAAVAGAGSAEGKKEEQEEEQQQQKFLWAPSTFFTRPTAQAAEWEEEEKEFK